MNRVRNRAGIMLLFIAVLVGGMCFFLWEYYEKAEEWVVFTGSPHVYEGASLPPGQILDRDGTLLMDTRGGRTYTEDALLRKSMLHWLGDRQGNIGAGVITNYLKEMSGFDPVNGIFSADGKGYTMSLTLSGRVQKAALEALAGRKGTVAVYNYKTGQILCAVSAPTFDPNNVPDITGDTTGAYEGVYVNRFAQSAYIPGSIFKVVTTAAALDSVPGIEEMTFTCSGTYAFGIDKVTCESVHGTKNIKGALASSCNCIFAQIAQLVGREAMMDYVRQFHITEPVTIDGIPTVSGNYDVNNAAAVELAWSCIGQDKDQINPAAFMTFMGAIAGGGVAAQPYVVESVQVGEDVTYRAETVELERVMEQSLASTVAAYMRNNVQTIYGDGNFPGLRVCAKSGTSELGGGQRPNAMFAGFVADEAYPLAFIVVVENGGYGSSACVPILSRVLAECKALLDSK